MIAVVDYRMGNLHSIVSKLEYLGGTVTIAARPEELSGANMVVLPGVGHFGEGMRNLHAQGLTGPLTDMVKKGVPVLGICLGAQLLTRHGEEGDAEGLGFIDATVRRFDAARIPPALKIPHMGWSTTGPAGNSRLMANISPDKFFYFVHSYHLDNVREEDVAATASYGYPFICAVERGNVFGTQFHPEKSHETGLTVLQNFLEVA